MIAHRSGTTRPMLESMEDRLTPSTAAFVAYLYNNVLAHAPSAGALQFWVDASEKLSDDAVLNIIWQSAEHRELQVKTYYRDILHRPLDPGGRDYWVGRMLAGKDEVDVQGGIYGSKEHLDQVFGTAAFVDDLYAVVLHRPADSYGQAFWTGAMQGGMSAETVARLVVDSPEKAIERVTDDYSRYLGRTPSDADLTWWRSYLQGGRSELRIDSLFLESAEASRQYLNATPLSNIATELLDATNAERARNGVAPLRFSAPLSTIAQAHSDWMAGNRTLTHQEGTLSYFGRLVQANYRAEAGAENIFQGLERPEDVMNHWLRSAANRTNILSSAFTEVGFAVSRAADGTTYWTADFGKPA